MYFVIIQQLSCDSVIDLLIFKGHSPDEANVVKFFVLKLDHNEPGDIAVPKINEGDLSSYSGQAIVNQRPSPGRLSRLHSRRRGYNDLFGPIRRGRDCKNP